MYTNVSDGGVRKYLLMKNGALPALLIYQSKKEEAEKAIHKEFAMQKGKVKLF